jgi:GT2 family glycosyltransferase
VNPSVAVVILNYNGIAYLQQFLPHLLKSTYNNYYIVVADNASTDGSVAFVKTNFPSIQVLVNSCNAGFASGYNWALQQLTADYFILLNSDVEVTPNWIEPLIHTLASNATIGAVQPKILSYANKNMFEYAGASGGFIDVLGYPFSRGRVFDVVEADNNQYNNATPIFWASGAALCIKSELFLQLGGFDERFFAHQEEIDLCWRLQLLNYTIMVCPTSVVYHVGAGTLPRGGKKVFLNFRNNLLMLSKNLPLSQKMMILPTRFLLDAISAWKGLLQGDVAFFKAIVKAHIQVVYYWIFKKHPPVPATKNIKTLQGVYNGSIVWQHFVKRKTTFSNIVHNK